MRRNELTERYNGPWASVPWQIFALYPIIGSTGVFLWIYLHARQNFNRELPECWPSQATIRKDTGLAFDTINKTIKKLESLGLLLYKPGEFNRRKVSRYITIWPNDVRVAELLKEHNKRGFIMSKSIAKRLSVIDTPKEESSPDGGEDKLLSGGTNTPDNGVEQDKNDYISINDINYEENEYIDTSNINRDTYINKTKEIAPEDNISESNTPYLPRSGDQDQLVAPATGGIRPEVPGVIPSVAQIADQIRAQYPDLSQEEVNQRAWFTWEIKLEQHLAKKRREQPGKAKPLSEIRDVMEEAKRANKRK